MDLIRDHQKQQCTLLKMEVGGESIFSATMPEVGNWPVVTNSTARKINAAICRMQARHGLQKIDLLFMVCMLVSLQTHNKKWAYARFLSDVDTRLAFPRAPGICLNLFLKVANSVIRIRINI